MADDLTIDCIFGFKTDSMNPVLDRIQELSVQMHRDNIPEQDLVVYLTTLVIYGVIVKQERERPVMERRIVRREVVTDPETSIPVMHTQYSDGTFHVEIMPSGYSGNNSSALRLTTEVPEGYTESIPAWPSQPPPPILTTESDPYIRGGGHGGYIPLPRGIEPEIYLGHPSPYRTKPKAPVVVPVEQVKRASRKFNF